MELFLLITVLHLMLLVMPLFIQKKRDTLRIPDKDVIDYTRDGAVALGKGIVAVPQALAGIVDIADAGLSAANVALQGEVILLTFRQVV